MSFYISEEAQKLHKCQLLIANEFKRICKKNCIKYFMIAGTLLGAVRHKGFIPWDDDMDFSILRKDFDRFLEVAKTDLSDKFVLQYLNTDKHYGLPIAKILLKDTVLVEKNTSKNKALKGIFIDIFPFDNIPNKLSDQKSHNRKTYFLKRLLLAKQNYTVADSFKKKVVYAFLKFISLFTSKKCITSKLDNTLKLYQYEDTYKVAAIGGAYGYYKESVLKEWFSDTIELKFEESEFSAPVGYIEYLKYFYNDYMELPPEDKRYNRHNLLELSFGPYDNI